MMTKKIEKTLITIFIFTLVMNFTMYANATEVPTGVELPDSIFSDNNELIGSWFDATVIAINGDINNVAQLGVLQTNNAGDIYRVMTGGYREDISGRKFIADTPIPPKTLANGTVVQRIGFIYEYRIDFDVLIRTQEILSTMGISWTAGNKYLTFATYKTQGTYTDSWDYKVRAKAKFPNAKISSDWMAKAEHLIQDTLVIKLELNPIWDFPASLNNGTYVIDGVSATFKGVRTTKEINSLTFSTGTLGHAPVFLTDTLGADNPQTIGGTGTTANEPNTYDPYGTGDDTSVNGASLQSTSVKTKIKNHLKAGTPRRRSPTVRESGKRSGVISKIYNTPDTPFDVFKIGGGEYEYSFDDSLANSVSSVFFPYSFSMRPETTLYRTTHYPIIRTVTHNTGLFGGVTYIKDDWGTFDVLSGYRVRNVFQKQTLSAVVRIVSTYDFIPTLPNDKPLDDPADIDIGTDGFDNIGDGSSGVDVEVDENISIDGFFESIGNIIGLVIGLVLVGVGLYIFLRWRNTPKQKLKRAREKEAKLKVKN